MPHVTERPELILTRNPNGNVNSREWGALRYPQEYEKYIKSFKGYEAQCAAARAITPAGFAQAFYKANR